jgi:hypothetical protein
MPARITSGHSTDPSRSRPGANTGIPPTAIGLRRVLIDGEPNTRRACAEACLGALGPDGVIVMDNTNEPYCQTGLEFLMSQGFKRIDFESLGPALVYGGLQACCIATAVGSESSAVTH